MTTIAEELTTLSTFTGLVGGTAWNAMPEKTRCLQVVTSLPEEQVRALIGVPHKDSDAACKRFAEQHIAVFGCTYSKPATWTRYIQALDTMCSNDLAISDELRPEHFIDGPFDDENDTLLI